MEYLRSLADFSLLPIFFCIRKITENSFFFNLKIKNIFILLISPDENLLKIYYFVGNENKKFSFSKLTNIGDENLKNI